LPFAPLASYAYDNPMTNDGWLLVSLFHAGPIRRSDPLGWKHLIGVADWINHAILSHDEVCTGVKTLARHGLLVEKAGVLVLTLRARRGMAAAYGTRKRMSVFKLWDAGDVLIASQKERASTVKGPTARVFRAALEAYGVTPLPT
jgi:hypothetical protein